MPWPRPCAPASPPSSRTAPARPRTQPSPTWRWPWAPARSRRAHRRARSARPSTTGSWSSRMSSASRRAMPAAQPFTTWRSTVMPTASHRDPFSRQATGDRSGARRQATDPAADHSTAAPLSPTAYRLPPGWWGLLPAALTLAGVAFFLREQLALDGNLWGVPLDDAYIHFRFAQNLAAGHGFSFNP